MLVAPEPRQWAKAARENQRKLRDATVLLAGTPLAEWRRRTRIALAGGDDRLIVVTGHQPEFIHAGVWAKGVVATRMADAVDGVVTHLVVDSDAARRTALVIPTHTAQGLSLTSVRYAEAPSDHPYEHIPRLAPGIVGHLSELVRAALHDRYEQTQMPEFFAGIDACAQARDWVAQMTAGRRAISVPLGVDMDERRVSDLDGNPLLNDMLLNAPRFAHSYNRALAEYRRVHRVRDLRRPMPDLVVDGGRCESAWWVYGNQGPRRRLFVGASGETLCLYADDVPIGTVRAADLRSGHTPGGAELLGWRLRPRALALTLWARLLLADLFIHGIGGAKYDRIADAITEDYYEIPPPHMACVSATLHLPFPETSVTEDCIRRRRHELRDLHSNPHRHISPEPDLQDQIDERARAVRLSCELAASHRLDRPARAAAYLRIRNANRALLARRPDLVSIKRAELQHALNQLPQTRIAQGREYFFGLFPREDLERLLWALPGKRDFLV